jgi:hypothetical protein
MTSEEFFAEMNALAERYLGSPKNDTTQWAFKNEAWEIVLRLYEAGGGLCDRGEVIPMEDLDLVVKSEGHVLRLTAARRGTNVTRH